MWHAQVKERGYEVDHSGYCITVFSAPNCEASSLINGAWNILGWESGDVGSRFQLSVFLVHVPSAAHLFPNP